MKGDLSLYLKHKEDMETGDLLQWHSYSVVGSLIRWRSSSEDNHTSMIIRLQEYEGSERRRFHTEAMERGVYPNLLSNRLSEFDGRVCWCPLKKEWNEKRTGIGVRLTEMWGRKYDFKSLFWQLIGKVSADTRRLFCSETAFLALGFTGKAPNPGEMMKLGVHRNRILIYDSKAR